MRLLLVAFIFIHFSAAAQDPGRFLNEVDALQAKYDTLWDKDRPTIVFVGSSSIRFWKNLPELFPGHQIINTGFGGSQTSDLLVYSDKLIHRFRPQKVFIYEGDNDINDAKPPRLIQEEMKALVSEIRQRNPLTEIIIISAKPSLVRWHLKPEYKRLNRKFRRMCKRDPLMSYADVWGPMMAPGNIPRQDIFIEDGLHMNEKGYDLWYEVISQYIN